jgi:excisionase family DNA binding protein
MRLLNAKEVAEILQVNTQRVYELTRQGILPSLRIGARQIRFEEARLLQWIENGGGLNAKNVEDYKPHINDVTARMKKHVSGAGRGGDGGNPHQGKREGSPLRLDDLREFEPIRFVLECTLRAG